MRLLAAAIIGLALVMLPAAHAAATSRKPCHRIVSGRHTRCAAAKHPLGTSSARRPTLSLYRRLVLAGLPRTTIADEPGHLSSGRWPEEPRLLDGWRIRSIDGDTFGYGPQRIRIRGIDAPEVSESGGFEATERMDLLLREGPVLIIPRALDTYGRTVADVFVNERSVAETMSSEGYLKAKPRKEGSSWASSTK